MMNPGSGAAFAKSDLISPSAEQFQPCFRIVEQTKIMLQLLAPSQPWLNALLWLGRKKRLKCGYEANYRFVNLANFYPQDLQKQLLPKMNIVKPKTKIDQLAKVLVGSQHKVPFNCRALSSTPYYTSFTYYVDPSAGFETAILDVLNEYSSSSSLARYVFL